MYPPPLPPSGSVEVPGRGAMWVYDSGGDLPPVVLLHGWTSTAALNWSATMGPLATTARVIAPDHRGHGRGLRTRNFSLEQCADDVAALIEALGVGPAVVVGYSMGGPIAMLTWRRHPGAVAGLVLCATAARFGRRSDLAPAVTAVGRGLSLLLAAMPRRWHAGALTRAIEARDPDPDRARWVISEQRRNDPGALVQAAAALNAFDARPWLAEVDVPTTVVVTARDETVSPGAQRRLAAAIAGAEVVSIPAGHRAAAESPGRFVPALRDGIASVWGRAGLPQQATTTP
ncbi:MAG TPA: alpha/beta hydrolase [Acidimicrobiales bacterium]|nr:alpha/beta hydrolase [Acidimicrobiales bacterium]